MSCFNPYKFTTTRRTTTPPRLTPFNISNNTATAAEAKDVSMEDAYHRTENQATTSSGQQKHPILSSDTEEGFGLPCPPLDEVDSMLCPTAFFDLTPFVFFMDIDDDDDDYSAKVAKNCKGQRHDDDEANVIKKHGSELDEASINKKLENTKTKLRRCYEKVARAKKRKQTKLLDLTSLPRCK